ncbi:MAG TPA: HD domain-containing protein, partial [Anaerolinea sp.]|nr:HD domain-containing protein [Anaerolinea sp.]
VQALTTPVKEESPAGLILGAAQATLGRYQPQFRAHLAQGMPNGRGLLVALKLAALYHDTGKATTASRDDAGRLHFYRHEEVSARLVAERARALAFSSEEVECCEIIVREHMRIHQLVAASPQPSPRSIYRFFRATGEAGVDVCLVSLADTLATYSHTLPQEHWLAELQVCRAILEARWEKDEEIVHPPRLLDGRELMAVFDLKPGPLIGALLEAIREAQAAGDVRGKEEALVVARKWLEQNKDGEHVEPTR